MLTKKPAAKPIDHMPSDRFRLLFEHSSDAHLIAMDDVITDCNDATIRLLKCSSKKEVLKIHPAQLSPLRQPDGQLSVEKAAKMDALARKNGYHRFEWMHQKVDGEVFPVQVTLNSIEIDGKPALIAVWHDLTELKQKEERLRSANEKMKKDLEAASAIQKAMLPISSPLVKGLRSSWAFNPCDELGGDILNIFSLDEKHVGLYVLDVTGHGLAASLLSVAVSHFLSPYSDASFVRNFTNGPDKMALARPAEVAEKLNRHFCSNPDLVQLFTLLYGVMNVESREFCYICAGHPLPVVVSGDGQSRMVEGSGLPIGVAQDFEYSELCLKLKPGDRLYLYSDGLTEAKNKKRDLFGEERLMDIFRKSRRLALSESTTRIVREVEMWCRPEKPDDDITLLVCDL